VSHGYCTVLHDVERSELHEWSGRVVGIDVGLEYFYSDSDGNTLENPRFLRKSEESFKTGRAEGIKTEKGF
jgi:putative transposase